MSSARSPGMLFAAGAHPGPVPRGPVGGPDDEGPDRPTDEGAARGAGHALRPCAVKEAPCLAMKVLRFPKEWQRSRSGCTKPLAPTIPRI